MKKINYYYPKMLLELTLVGLGTALIIDLLSLLLFTQSIENEWFYQTTAILFILAAIYSVAVIVINAFLEKKNIDES